MKPGVDFIGVGVAAIILNKKGEVFLAKRGKKARNQQGTWECPGGAVEFDETLEQAIVREVKEELGINVKILEKTRIFEDILIQEVQHWLFLPFICEIVSGEPKILEPEKCDAIGWFSLKDMSKMKLSQATTKIYKNLLLKN